MHQGRVAVMGWVDDFAESPQRPIGPTKPGTRVTPATILRRETIKAIQELKYLGSRPAVIPVFTGQVEHGGKKYQVGRLGASDLIICWYGHAFMGEIKAGSDRQSDRQKKFQMRTEQAGGTYILIRKPADAIDAMMRWYQVNVQKLQIK